MRGLSNMSDSPKIIYVLGQDRYGIYVLKVLEVKVDSDGSTWIKVVQRSLKCV